MRTERLVRVADLKVNNSYLSIYNLKSRQLELLVDSIKKTGLLEPIIINRNNEIINGVQRWLAYKELERTEIPAIILDIEAEEEVLYMISYNRYKEKTMQERWQEIQAMKGILGNCQGQRTDLNDGAEKISTRKKIALYMNISEGNVYKIVKIAEADKNLFVLIDSREMSLHEAYQRVEKIHKKVSNTSYTLPKVSQGQIPSEVPEHKCPHCGHQF